MSHTVFLPLTWVNIVKVLVQIFRFKFTFPGIFFHLFLQVLQNNKLAKIFMKSKNEKHN